MLPWQQNSICFPHRRLKSHVIRGVFCAKEKKNIQFLKNTKIFAIFGFSEFLGPT